METRSLDTVLPMTRRNVRGNENRAEHATKNLNMRAVPVHRTPEFFLRNNEGTSRTFCFEGMVILTLHSPALLDLATTPSLKCKNWRRPCEVFLCIIP